MPNESLLFDVWRTIGAPRNGIIVIPRNNFRIMFGSPFGISHTNLKILSDTQTDVLKAGFSTPLLHIVIASNVQSLLEMYLKS